MPWTVKAPAPSLRIVIVIAMMLSGWRGRCDLKLEIEIRRLLSETLSHSRFAFRLHLRKSL
jgi:hypothetical protein